MSQICGCCLKCVNVVLSMLMLSQMGGWCLKFTDVVSDPTDVVSVVRMLYQVERILSHIERILYHIEWMLSQINGYYWSFILFVSRMLLPRNNVSNLMTALTFIIHLSSQYSFYLFSYWGSLCNVLLTAVYNKC